MKSHIFKLVILTLFITGLFSHLHWSDEARWKKRPAKTSIGNLRTLLAAYDQWKTQYVRNGGDQKLNLKLAYTKALSAEATKAHGEMTLDLTDGTLLVKVSGLSDNESFDVWLINNRPGAGPYPKAEPGDAMVQIA